MNSGHQDYRSKLLEDPAYAIEALKGEFIMDVTESICELLENEGIERQELARRMGKTKGYISQLLNGDRNMTLATLAEIAYVLNYGPTIKFQKKVGKKLLLESREADTPVECGIRDGASWVKPLKSPEYTLEQLLNGIIPENLHKETENSQPMGNET